ncbi:MULTISPECIES: hypothetical protein [Ochrobactrum]|uniref:Uncharacterized protein n=1 Tax=Ochrobactrum chromiisoli TaxID=2993941 RepID=A0ABT3QUP5_9HYPH|nr:hypothetical protein [Ochrobactrum chromiisoli]MCX2699340.1 hypothetical protein [Ochrobactrum chromiisoli]
MAPPGDPLGAGRGYVQPLILIDIKPSNAAAASVAARHFSSFLESCPSQILKWFFPNRSDLKAVGFERRTLSVSAKDP